MLISTRGRYALRVMLDLAAGENAEDYVSLGSIAERQGISVKYMESIIAVLSKAGLVEGVRGKGGGYRLCRKPEDYTAGEILRLTEGSLAPVPCLDCKPNTCERAGQCQTLPLWKELDSMIAHYLDHVTLKAILDGDVK